MFASSLTDQRIRVGPHRKLGRRRQVDERGDVDVIDADAHLGEVDQRAVGHRHRHRAPQLKLKVSSE